VESSLLRLRALLAELEECRTALRSIVDDDARKRARRHAGLLRGAALLGLATLFAAGLAVFVHPGFGASSSSSDPSPCGPGAASLTDVHLSEGSGTITATFTVASGCDGTTVSLATYSMLAEPGSKFPQTLYDSVTQTLDAGSYTLTVHLPSCFWQADLVTGAVLPYIDANHLYGDRVAAAVKGGDQVCSTTTTTGTTQTTTTQTTTTSTMSTTTTLTTTTSTTTTSTTTTTTPPPTVFKPPVLCPKLTLTLAHRTAFVGRQTLLVVHARRNNGKGVGGVRVEVRGPGVLVFGKTNTHGVARFKVKPHSIGILRVRLLDAASCGPQLREVPVRGPFKPPRLTG
jgi:hypothetical protein